MYEIKPEVFALARKAEERCAEIFRSIDETALKNSLKVLSAFQEEKVSESCFAGTTGYGYDDLGRDTLERVYCRVFHTEAALVRVNIVNGTQALSAALYSMLAPGDTLLSVSGTPYDTLLSTIDPEGKLHGSLGFYGVKYDQVNLINDCSFDYDGITEALKNNSVKAVEIQRSRGYGTRKAFTVDKIGEVCALIKKLRPDVSILVDNCYGEFVEELEPTDVGADLIAGSLIKNPGGGIAPTGGYLAGRAELVRNAAMHLTTPGIAGECGSTLGNNRLLFQGFFLAPHVVAQALKTSVFCASIMDLLNMKTSPAYDEGRGDIIQVVETGSTERMKAFCLGIQSGSPVDSYVTPEPWPMPGYDCDVIMAAGAFIQGSSIELSADGPIRPPYCVYMQGGITYESGKLGVMNAVSRMI